MLALAGLIAIGNTVALLSLSSTQTVWSDELNRMVTYSFSESERWRWIFGYVAQSVWLYGVIAILPQVLRGQRQLICFPIGIVAIAAISMVYSFLFEWDTILSFLKGNSTYIQSFYSNRNPYGACILLAIMACGYLLSETGKLRWSVPMFAFTGFSLLIMSKTSMACEFLYGIALLVVMFIKKRKTRPIASRLIFYGVIGTVSSVVFLGVTGLIQHVPLLNALWNGASSHVIATGMSTILSRMSESAQGISLTFSNPISFIFGIGEYQSNVALAKTCSEVRSALFYTHNFHVDQWVSGGLLRTLVYAAFAAYALIKLLGNVKARGKTAVTSLIALSVTFFYGFFETSGIFAAKTLSACFMFVSVIPELTASYCRLSPEKERERENALNRKTAFPSLKFQALDVLRVIGILAWLILPVALTYGFSRDLTILAAASSISVASFMLINIYLPFRNPLIPTFLKSSMECLEASAETFGYVLDSAADCRK